MRTAKCSLAARAPLRCRKAKSISGSVGQIVTAHPASRATERMNTDHASSDQFWNQRDKKKLKIRNMWTSISLIGCKISIYKLVYMLAINGNWLSKLSMSIGCSRVRGNMSIHITLNFGKATSHLGQVLRRISSVPRKRLTTQIIWKHLELEIVLKGISGLPTTTLMDS